jgi:hypothetical protein
MEEADALADRVGVLAKHILDIGTTSHLRTKHGYGFHIHLVLKSAPQSSAQEMANLRSWIEKRFPGAEMEREPWHGQLRFNIPSISHLPPDSSTSTDITELATGSSSAVVHAGKWQGEREEPSVGSLFVLLEENKASLGLEFYSVSVSTFDEIFLKVVKKHGVGEEDHAEVAAWKKFVLYLRDVVVRLPFM